MITDTLLRKYPIVSDQIEISELRVLLCELESLLLRNTKGNVVEFGCYVGTTSLFIRRLLDYYKSPAQFHVYDSFLGLPEKAFQDSSPAGEQFRMGELCASKKQFVEQFKKANLQLPVIHKGWFSELTSHDIPSDVMFAFLDGDYYESIRDSFRALTPHLCKEAVIIVDDYANEALPGAAKATDEWCRGRDAKMKVHSSLACIQCSKG